MPDITVQQSIFERLQHHAKPFIDTPETVIARALDALDQLSGKPVNEIVAVTAAETEHRIDPRALPNLTHTKVLEALIGGEMVARANWNLLLEEILRHAVKRVGSFEKARQLCAVNMVKGRKEDEGYSYLRDVDLSVQGQDANGACRAIVMAAQGLGLALDIRFMWRLKEAAAHPGEHGRLQVKGLQSAVAALRATPKPSAVETREPIEMPERARP